MKRTECRSASKAALRSYATATVLAISGSSTLAWDGEPRVVMAVGLQDSGPLQGDTVAALSYAPDLNNRGMVTFSCSTVSGDDYLWLVTGNEYELVAGTTQPPPGSAGVFQITEESLNDAGTVAFVTYGAPSGVWIGSPGNVEPVLNSSIAPPEIESGTFAPVGGADWQIAALNDNGDVVVQARVDYEDGSRSRALFTNSSLIIRAETTVPALPNAIVSRFSWISLGNTGRYAFLANVVADGSVRHVVFNGQDGSLSLVHDPEIPLPGHEDCSILGLESPRVDCNGGVLFLAKLGTCRVSADIWRSRDGVLTPIVRTGDPVDGLSGPLLLGRGSFENSRCNRLMLSRWVTEELILWQDGAASLFAQVGTSTTRGLTITRMVPASAMLNNWGQAALYAELADAEGSQSYGIVATTRAGELTVIARVGDRFSPEDNALISSLSMIQFNDRGEVLARTSLRNGTDAIILAALPDRCIADHNGDLAFNILDVLGFVDAWFDQDSLANANLDDAVDVADLLLFLDQWLDGCG